MPLLSCTCKLMQLFSASTLIPKLLHKKIPSHLLELLEGLQLSEFLLLFGHSPDELVELLGALRQRVDVELRPEGVAVLVDHGRMIDVDLVNLLKESEVLLQLQKPGRQLQGSATLFMV